MTHWINHRREQLNMTQKDLAERLTKLGLPLTPGAISQWEKYRVPVPLQIAENRKIISQALALPIREMLILDGYEIEDNWSQSARLVAMLYETLEPSKQETLLILLDHFRAQTAREQLNKEKEKGLERTFEP